MNKLKSELYKQFKADKKPYNSYSDWLESRLAVRERQIEVLKEALTEYSTKSNWIYSQSTQAKDIWSLSDKGYEQAQQALSEFDKMEKEAK